MFSTIRPKTAFFAAAICLALAGTAQAAETSAASGVAINYHFDAKTTISKTSPVAGTVQKAMEAVDVNFTAGYDFKYKGYALLQVAKTSSIMVPDKTTGKVSTPYWLLCVNGKTAEMGMTQQAVNAGDTVDWYYTKQYKCGY